jgi:hypothetical protein
VKFEWQGNSEAGGSAIIASPESYDAVPFMKELMIDGRPRVVSADRLAVATILAFGFDSSGSVELPFPIGPTTAQAIQEFLDPTWVTVSPIDFVPKALPIGVTRMHLTMDSPAERNILNSFDKQRTVHFELRRSDRYAGQLMSLDHHIVVSNAWIFGEAESERSFLAALAVGVLFAESLQVDVIEFPQLVRLLPETARSVSKLLQSCRLALDIVGTENLAVESAGADSRA